MQDTKRKHGSKGLKSQIIRIEEEQLSKYVDKVVRGTVEETLNALLNAEADRLCRARRYEHTETRKDTRAGYYTRKLGTKGVILTLTLKCTSPAFRSGVWRILPRRCGAHG